MIAFFTPFVAQILLVMMHIAGLLGLNNSYTRPYFEALIAFNLLSNAFILFYFHYYFSKKTTENSFFSNTNNKENHFYFFVLISFFVGFFIEVLGVHSKIIFGKYWYVKNMGIKFLEVPLLIGINWFLLAYCAGILSEFVTKKLPKNIFQSIFFKAFLGAFLMTYLDYWIEPFAIHFQMWAWKDNIIPLQNYVGWFFTAYFLMLVFHYLSFHKKNPIAIWLFLCQFFFFVGNFLIKV